MSTIYVTEPGTAGKVCLHTTVGDIDIELWSKECPLACRNFVQLCMEGYYTGTIFHRLVKDFIVQGGDPTGTGQGGESVYGKNFKDEFHQRLKFNRRGLMGMANGSEKDSNGSQFFFTLGPAEDLNKKHTLFAKVVGDTLFNMLRMSEFETDANERPLIITKISGVTVLNNPFPDIVPREKKLEKKKPKTDKVEKKPQKKNLSLLSFGDEAMEDEEELDEANAQLKFKSKSAHDLLNDEKLSRVTAISLDELVKEESSTPDPDAVNREAEERIERIRSKLMKRKLKTSGEDEKEEDEDLGRMIDEERMAIEKQQLEHVSAEVKAMQKKYARMLRKPKEVEGAKEEEPKTEGMQMYKKLTLKYKDRAKVIVKQKDSGREKQTFEMLEKFKAKLSNSNREAILFDRKVEMPVPEKPTETPEKPEEPEVPLGKPDLDGEDIKGEDWLLHRFVAPEEQKQAMKIAKDANMRETDEDWYDVTDPRNKMAQRRRAE